MVASAPVLATKLFIPPPPPRVVSRARLIERLNEGLQCTLTVISAPAGFGKTTLVSGWVATLTPAPGPLGEGDPKGRVRAAWLSLDESDNNPTRFLIYLISALRRISPNLGAGLLDVLQSPQPPSLESILTALLNEISAVTDDFILILDDYHMIDSRAVDKALTFLVEHLPPRMLQRSGVDHHVDASQYRRQVES
jgi:LuxR family maltose regulon positive regulatory protein